MKKPVQSEQPSRLDRFGKCFGVFGASLCALLFLAIMAAMIRALTLQNGDTGGAMGIGMIYVILIPLVGIPVLLICATGAVLSAIAMAKQSTPEARLGLLLSLVSPAAVTVLYIMGFAFM